MKLKLIVIAAITLCMMSSCQKEGSLENGNPLVIDSTGTGGGGGTTGTLPTMPGITSNFPGCNNSGMRIKKWQNVTDTGWYTAVSWNADNTVKSIRHKHPFSGYRTINLFYSGGKITSGEIVDISTGSVVDTAIFRYNSNNLVDSMYLKNTDGYGRKITYVNNRPTRISRHTGSGSGDIMYYWTVTTDNFGNVTASDEWYNNSGTFAKESIYTFTYDNKKNPFLGMAPYMFYLDDEYKVVAFWGPNNQTNQNFTDVGTSTNVLTGFQYTYNGNCYPASSKNTLMGFPISNTEDWLYSYY